LEYGREEELQLYRNIGNNIKYYRLLYSLERRKLTQERLAEKIDVSTAFIGNLESNKIKQGLSVYTLYKLSKALNVSIDDLVAEPKIKVVN